RGGLEEHAAQVAAWEADTRRLEEGLERREDAIHEQDALLAGARQQIAAVEATLGAERAQSADLERELSATRKRLAELSTRVGALAEAAAQAAEELASADGESKAQLTEVSRLEQELRS